MDRYDLQNRYLDLTRVLLPSLGRTRGWVVKEDHSFTRIVLDHLFADSWERHLGRGLRAYKQLNDTQLAQAVAIAEKMTKAGVITIAEMNAQSLAWRDKPQPQTVKHHPPRLARS